MIPRARTWGDGVTILDSVKERNTGSGWETMATYEVATAVDTGRLAGFDIPNYHARKRRGDLLPMTPFTMVTEVSEILEASYTYTTLGGTLWRYNPPWQVAMIVAPSWRIQEQDVLDVLADVDLDDFVQMAAARIYASGWDALTFASELGKVLEMFIRFRKNLFRNLRRARFDRSWLEARYGWRPLLYDIQDITKVVNTLDDSRKRFSERVGTTTTHSEQTVDSSNRLSTQDGESTTFDVDYSLSVRGSVVADIEPPKIQTNAAITAWERVPYSFIADWFVNIGTWLESLSFLALATNYTAAAGVQVDMTRSATFVPGSVSPTVQSSSLSLSTHSNMVYSFRRPTSVSKMPQPRVNLNIEKLVDLAALARAMRK